MNVRRSPKGIITIAGGKFAAANDAPGPRPFPSTLKGSHLPLGLFCDPFRVEGANDTPFPGALPPAIVFRPFRAGRNAAVDFDVQ